jgi:hypothetical protein
VVSALRRESIVKDFPEQITHSSGAPMFLERNRLLLAFQKRVTRERLERVLRELDLFLDEEVRDDTVPSGRVNHTDLRFWVQSRSPIDEDRYQQIQRALRPLGLDWISPVYRLSSEEGPRALLAPLPNVIVVRIGRPGSADQVSGTRSPRR